MNCRHCEHWNPEGEQRCRLCGRKLDPHANDSTSDWAYAAVAGNLAAAPERAPCRRPEPTNEAPQRSLFPDRPVAKAGRFEVLSGGAKNGPRTESAAAPRIRAVAAPARVETPRKPVARPAIKRTISSELSDTQPELDFLPAAPMAPRT